MAWQHGGVGKAACAFGPGPLPSQGQASIELWLLKTN